MEMEVLQLFKDKNGKKLVKVIQYGVSITFFFFTFFKSSEVFKHLLIWPHETQRILFIP